MHGCYPAWHDAQTNKFLGGKKMDTYSSAYTAAATGAMAVYYILCLVIAVVSIIGMWKFFSKAGKPGWASIVPFYNMYCLFDIAWGNGWMFLLCFIPCVGAVFQIILCFKLAKAFGQGTGFGFGLLFLSPIFYMILGFGDSDYIGPQ